MLSQKDHLVISRDIKKSAAENRARYEKERVELEYKLLVRDAILLGLFGLGSLVCIGLFIKYF